MLKKKFTAFIGLVLAAGLLTACNTGPSSSDAGENGSVTIGFQKGNTLNLLKARGNLDERLEEMGYSVNWQEFAIGTALLEALNTDKIDFGHASDANSVFSAAGGRPIQYVASETPYPEGVALVSKKGSGIESVKDLLGKKIGVTKGGNMHYLLLRALEENGYDESDVQTVYYTGASDGLSAFQQGSFDVLGTWDPYLAIIESQVETTTVTSGLDMTDNRTFYFGSADILKDKPEVVKAILEELEVSDQWANGNKDGVAEILAEELGLDKEPLQTANNRRSFGVLPVDEAAVTEQQRLADTFFGIKLFEKPITIADSVTEDAPWIPEGIK